ncbi:MAG: neutral zinc metallopeptidase [Betaproteobacteria bacterium]|nr:neutral zinc metallopeptidase [Betaproteobacteria bacterium]
MRWGDMRPSDNVEDRRGSGGGRLPLGGGMRLGGGALIVVVILSLVFGVNPMQFLGMMEGAGPAVAPPQPAAPAQTAPAPAAKDPEGAFVRRTLGDTEDVWTALFEGMGSRYEPPRLVLFAGATPSACGHASAAAGPFYCPADRKVYLDTAFFQELSRKFGAPGDFAAAYVIAHEIGHHVQNQMGTMRKFDQAAARTDARGRNALSVRLELQADCYAGVWGFYAAKRNLLEPGDVEEGLRAASAVGDDTIQQRARGHVVPDAFTHGSADQRVRWFRAGLASGDPRSCNTFANDR